MKRNKKSELCLQLDGWVIILCCVITSRAKKMARLFYFCNPPQTIKKNTMTKNHELEKKLQDKIEELDEIMQRLKVIINAFGDIADSSEFHKIAHFLEKYREKT